MSTNKTERYGLHAWELGDDFILSEINENFALLDGATRVVVGRYTGTGTDKRFIDLGFTPQAVLLIDKSGSMTSGYSWYGGLAVQGGDSVVLAVTEGGFTLREYDKMHGNSKPSDNVDNYYYLAVR